jgi:hypothetical protein
VVLDATALPEGDGEMSRRARFTGHLVIAAGHSPHLERLREQVAGHLPVIARR